MVIARSVNEVFNYVCKAERELPQDQRTVFHLRPLSAFVGMALENLNEASSDGSRVQLRIGDQKKVALLAGLAGWDNLRNAQGEVVEFRSKKGTFSICGISVANPADQATVDLLPQDVAEELVDAIRSGSAFTADAAKN
jgi:hypothetical protein